MADIIPSSNSGYKLVGTNDELPTAHPDGFSSAVSQASRQPLLVSTGGVVTAVDTQQLIKSWQESGLQSFSVESVDRVLSVLNSAKSSSGTKMDTPANLPANTAWPSAAAAPQSAGYASPGAPWPQGQMAMPVYPYGQPPAQPAAGVPMPPAAFTPDMQFPYGQPYPPGAYPPGAYQPGAYPPGMYPSPPSSAAAMQGGPPGAAPWNAYGATQQAPTMLATVNLTTVEPPNVDVFFDMDAGGALTAWYHAVIPSDKGLLLIFDTRSRGATQFVPPEGRPIKVQCKALSDRQVSAASCGLSFALGPLEVVVLIFVVQSEDQPDNSQGENSEALADLMKSVLR